MSRDRLESFLPGLANRTYHREVLASDNMLNTRLKLEWHKICLIYHIAEPKKSFAFLYLFPSDLQT